MNPEANKALVRRIYEQGFNQGNTSVFDELYAPDFRHHDKSVHDVSPGAAGERESMLRFRAAIPDVHFAIEAQIAEGDLVVNQLLLTGTPVREFPPLRPEDGPLQRRAVAIFRIADGVAVEEWFYTA